MYVWTHFVQLREAVCLEYEVSRLDNAGRQGYEAGRASTGGGIDEAEEHAAARLAALQKDIEALKDAADLGGQSGAEDERHRFQTQSEAMMCAHRHGMVRMRVF